MKPNRQESANQKSRNESALFEAVAELQNTAECRDFFKDLCTPAELQALADRWRVVGLLQRELPYRQIHELTGVSVTTIGRVARTLLDGRGGYTLVIDRNKQKHRARKSSASH